MTSYFDGPDRTQSVSKIPKQANRDKPLGQKIEDQNAEFRAVAALVSSYDDLPAVVDDSYPARRQQYEQAVKALIVAFKNNGRQL